MSSDPRSPKASIRTLDSLPHRIDSRDVLDPNGMTRNAFQGTLLGAYRRLGPNVWDDYELQACPPELVEVLSGIMIQLEPEGTLLRLRRHGRVIVVTWSPTPEEDALIATRGGDARAVLLERHVREYASPPGLGPAAVIAKKLKESQERG
jgi:hypothetical protein